MRRADAAPQAANHQPRQAAHKTDAAPPGDSQPTPRQAPAPVAAPRAPQVFGGLKWVSFTHSCIYAALLVCAFAAGGPQPVTFVLGLTHGLLWIAMSLTCIACVRLRVLPLRLAAAVAVLGGIGPFFGSYEFVREQRRRRIDPATGERARSP